MITRNMVFIFIGLIIYDIQWNVQFITILLQFIIYNLCIQVNVFLWKFNFFRFFQNEFKVNCCARVHQKVRESRVAWFLRKGQKMNKGKQRENYKLVHSFSLTEVRNRWVFSKRNHKASRFEIQPFVRNGSIWRKFSYFKRWFSFDLPLNPYTKYLRWYF